VAFDAEFDRVDAIISPLEGEIISIGPRALAQAEEDMDEHLERGGRLSR
jgi:hypothetical protein